MSSPGYVSTQGQNGIMTPEYLQQLQAWSDSQKRQAIAQTLMQHNANPATPNSGLANAGGDIAGALAARSMQQRANPDHVNVTPQVVGGGIGGWTSRNLPGLSNLFGLGGSQ